MKQVFISIINFNKSDITVDCLYSLEKLKVKNFELHVVVIDNASKEPFQMSPDKFKTFQLTVIHNPVNTGFSGGHNTGMKYALEHGANYVMVFNNDTYVDSHMVHHLFEAAEADPKAGIVAPKIYFAKGHEYHKDRYQDRDLGKVFWYAGGEIDWANVMGKHRGVDEVDHGQFDTEAKTQFASGCCMLIRKEAIEKAGYFDERYFLYFEDADLNERIKRAGFHILFVPKAVMWHINAGSTGGSGSPLQEYYTSRNRLLFGMTYAPLRTKIALFRESMRFLRTGRDWQKKGVRDFYLQKFGKGSYGV